MARPLRIEFEGAVYHVTARGNERGEIYKDDRDHAKHIEILKENKERYGVRIYAYVLMGNHYHLLVGTPEGNLTSFMHAAQAHYSNYHNRRHGRVGHLFQGRYKALIVDRDSYLVGLSRYIHLNPLRAGLVERPEQWAWSSYRSYLSGGKGADWVDAGEVLAYFGKRRACAAQKYRAMVENAIGKEEADPAAGAVAQLILGEEEFVERIKKILGDKSQSQPTSSVRELPAARRLSRWGIREAYSAVAVIAERFGVEKAEILRPRMKDNFPRAAAMMIFRERSRWTIDEIGRFFGVSYSAVANYLAGTRRALEKDKKKRKTLEELKGVISV